MDKPKKKEVKTNEKIEAFRLYIANMYGEEFENSSISSLAVAILDTRLKTGADFRAKLLKFRAKVLSQFRPNENNSSTLPGMAMFGMPILNAFQKLPKEEKEVFPVMFEKALEVVYVYHVDYLEISLWSSPKNN